MFSQEKGITFHSEDLDFKLNNQKILGEWISNTIFQEHKELGLINYIFCSDEYLYQINIKHLNHNTYTDIITFNYCEGNIVSSDIFISIDRVKENAIKYSTSFENELHRVMIHGILHLVGYNDKTKSEQQQMTLKEDFYLTLLKV